LVNILQMVSKYSVAGPSQPKASSDTKDMVTSVTLDDMAIPRRKDSEDSVQSYDVGSNMCGSNVLCNSSDILSNIFPCLSHYNIDGTSHIAPQKVNSIVGRSLNLTPSTTPIRRGRFLVWPAVLDCDAGLPTCAAIPILSSSSSSE
jgi:hypothetical protein